MPVSPSGSPITNYPYGECLFSPLFFFFFSFFLLLVLILTFFLHSDNLSLFPTSLILIQKNKWIFNYNIEHVLSCILSLFYLHFHLRPFHLNPFSPMTALSYFLEAMSLTILKIPNSFLTFLFWTLWQIIIRGKCFFESFRSFLFP